MSEEVPEKHVPEKKEEVETKIRELLFEEEQSLMMRAAASISGSRMGRGISIPRPAGIENKDQPKQG